jgi:hypothetical protein
MTSKRGQQWFIDGVTSDGSVVCWPLSGDVWIVPIEEIIGKSTIRLPSRTDWLVQPIERADSALPTAVSTELVSRLKAERLIESDMGQEAKDESAFYDKLLNT